MKDLNRVLQRVFTAEFYRLNTMFFLLIAGLAFGFMSGYEHKALADFITGAPWMWLSAAAIWTIYGVKIHSFNLQVCRMKEVNFIHDLSLIPATTQFICLAMIVFNQFMPATGYGIFLIAVAVKNSMIISAAALASSLCILITIFSLLLYRRIGTTEKDVNVSALKRLTDQNLEKTLMQFFVEWLLRNHPGLILFTKLFGCTLIFGISQLYLYDAYDYRLMALGCLASFSTSFIVVYHYVIFENQKFQILRNLPITLVRRLSYFTFSMLILCIPEFIILIRNYPASLPLYGIVENAVFVSSLFMLCYAMLLRIGNNLEGFSGTLFIGIMCLVVVILFSAPLYAIALVAFMTSILVYRRSFYSFSTRN